jgi:hypothetical protein
MAGVALFVAGLLEGAEIRPGDAWVVALPFAVLFLVLTLGPPLAVMAGLDSPNGLVSRGLGSFQPFISLAAGALAVLLLLRAGTLRSQALAMLAACALLIVTVSIQSSRGVFKFYDLGPLGKALEPYKQGPIAVFNQYAGEFGFMARLAHPVEVRRSDELKAWLEEHPDGTAVVRLDSTDRPEAGTVVHDQPFRPNKIYSVVRAKPD